MNWLVRSPKYPDVVIPVRDEIHALQLITGFRRIAAAHRAQVPWEYGTHRPGEHGSYRKVGPRPQPRGTCTR